MKYNLKKYYLLIFLYLTPIIDLITSISINYYNKEFTIGIVIKSIFILITSIYFILNIKHNSKKDNILYLILLLAGLFYLINTIYNGNRIFITELTNLIKLLYLPILLLTLKDNNIIISKKTIINLDIIYLLLIMIPTIFNINFNCYTQGKIGSIGLFNSANEITAVLCLFMPYIIDYIFNKDNNIFKKILLIIISIYCYFNIGSKLIIITLILTLFIKLFILFKNNKLNKKYLLLLIPILILSIIFIPRTNFYYNLTLHLNFLGISSLNDIFTYNFINRFIFSDRLTFFLTNFNIYINSSINNILFGIGLTSNYVLRKTIEMDIFDMIFNYGIILSIINIYIIYYVIKYHYNNLSLTDKLSIIIFIIASILSGHVINSPGVSIYLLLILKQNTKQERLIIFANDLRVGGIETSLINFLSNLSTKYQDITLVLEHKKGSLLKEVPDNITIIDYNLSNNKNILLRKITNYLKRIIFLIIHEDNYTFSCCYATYSLLGNKLSLSVCNNNSIIIHSNYTKTYNNRDFYNFFNTRNITKYKNIIFVSNESKKDFINLYPNLKTKSIVINNFIDYNKIITKSKEKIDITKPNKILFVFVGRLDESSKSLTKLLKLTKSLENKVETWIIGDGKDKKLYEDIIKKDKITNIKLFGNKDNPYPYMNLADYIILTSKYEGFPVVYQEAITLKKKIITTIDVSDESISIKDNFGYIISYDDDLMLSEVKDILSNDKLKYKDINPDNINKKRLKLLTNIISGGYNE